MKFKLARVFKKGRGWLISLGILPLAVVVALLWHPLYVFACAVTGVQAFQAPLPEVALTIERASLSRLGSDYPILPPLEKGYPQSKLVEAPAPCVILKAIGYEESYWRQATGSVTEGSTGPVKQSATCGYGIMQITSGMRNPGELPAETQQRIAQDYRYNIGWGAKMLADKWNAMDYFNAVVGDRDPAVAEDWYYAVWAYNQFNFRNNPNNPDYPWPRPAFDGTQSRLNYPYQELVWGYAAHPPQTDGKPLWEPLPLTLPNREAIGQEPGPIAAPALVHSAACRTLFSDPGQVSWSLQPGSVAPQYAVSVFNAQGASATAWTSKVEGGTWLTVTPSAGQGLPAQMSLKLNLSRLSAGTYQATVIVTAQDGSSPAVIPVQLDLKGSNNRFIPYLPRRALGTGH